MFIPINLLKLSFKIILQMANFALPLPIKWSVGKNKFNEENPNEPLLAIQVPVESVTSLIEHLTNLVNTKQVTKPVYDPKVKKSDDKPCVMLYCKGTNGDYGLYGSFSPLKIEDAPDLNQMEF